MEDLKFKTAEQTMKHTNKKGTDPDFYTNMNKGFAMTINGYRISVQWGPHNYVSDTDVRRSSENPQEYNIWGCDTAEVLIWDEKGRFAKHAGGSLFETAPWNDETDEYDFEWCNAFQFGHNDQVFGHCSSECVAKMIATLSSCGDEDPRNAIGQIYEFDIKKK
jgi:hypothetical protein